MLQLQNYATKRLNKTSVNSIDRSRRYDFSIYLKRSVYLHHVICCHFLIQISIPTIEAFLIKYSIFYSAHNVKN